jgi:hypothetical protein
MEVSSWHQADIPATGFTIKPVDFDNLKRQLQQRNSRRSLKLSECAVEHIRGLLDGIDLPQVD